MTSLINRIKVEQLQARKARLSVETALLTTLLGEASMPGKNDGNRDSTDAEVIATIKKFIKNIDSLPVEARTEVSAVEKILLESFLPKQMTLDQLTFAIEKCLSAEPGIQMGGVMSHLKRSFDGQYDAGLASKLIKEKMAK